MSKPHWSDPNWADYYEAVVAANPIKPQEPPIVEAGQTWRSKRSYREVTILSVANWTVLFKFHKDGMAHKPYSISDFTRLYERVL